MNETPKPDLNPKALNSLEILSTGISRVTAIPRLLGMAHPAGEHRPNRRLWLWTVMSAVMLVLAGLAAHMRVGAALRIELDEDLRAMLSTKLAWVELWYDEQVAAVESTSKEPFTRTACCIATSDPPT